MEPAPITRDEVDAFLGALNLAFHREPGGPGHDRYARLIEPERCLAARDGARIVGTAGIYSRRMTVPGGERPVAAVTLVGVLASHRRRGVLSALMRRQLADVHERGEEAFAALWASEGAIYGRFGYGMAAASGRLEVRRRQAGLPRPPAPGGLALESPADAVPAMTAVYDAARRKRPGMLDRSPAWWEFRIADPAELRDGADALRAVVLDGAYALYAVKSSWDRGRPAGEVRVREAMAADPGALAALWHALLSLDLTEQVVYDLAPADHPLPLMVAEPQAVELSLSEGLWIRLVDVDRALAERSYAQPFEVVLEVTDDVCPWNAGRHALAWDGTRAACEPTRAAADLALDVADLGAASLGGTTLDALALAGRVRELRPGALAVASPAFRGVREPWCPEIF